MNNFVDLRSVLLKSALSNQDIRFVSKSSAIIRDLILKPHQISVRSSQMSYSSLGSIKELQEGWEEDKDDEVE